MKKNIVIPATIAILAALIGGSWLLYNDLNSSVLPKSVSKQVHFQVFYPGNAKKYPVSQDSISYDSDTKVLRYTTEISGNSVIVNQQAEPETFKDAGSDIALYQKLLDKMHQYQDVDSDVGTVTLTHPEELKGGQAAVMDERGTLLFAQPQGDLSEGQWKGFFDSLTVIQQ